MTYGERVMGCMRPGDRLSLKGERSAFRVVRMVDIDGERLAIAQDLVSGAERVVSFAAIIIE